MAAIQGPRRDGVVQMRSLVARLNKLFELPAPVKVKAEDGTGEVVPVQHRIGKDGGFYTKTDLMHRLGFEKEYTDFCRENRRNFADPANFQSVIKEVRKSLMARMNRVVSEYRRHLEHFYAAYPRPLIPMFAFVPVGDKTEGLYIQGLQDSETMKPVIFDSHVDIQLWTGKTFSSTKAAADTNVRAKRTARQSMSLPNVNKDILYRLKQIADGVTPEHLLLPPTDEDDAAGAGAKKK